MVVTLPVKLALSLHQGASLSRAWIWKNPDETPRDLTGYTGRCDFRAKAGAPVQMSLTTANGGFVITALQGKFSIEVNSILSESLKVGVLLFDVVLIAPGGEPVTVMICGKATIEPGITQL